MAICVRLGSGLAIGDCSGVVEFVAGYCSVAVAINFDLV